MLVTARRQTGSPGMPSTVGTVTSEDRESTQWKIYGERLVDENPFIRLSIASVGLPDGTEFEQYVMRMRRTATTVVVDDQDRVLLMRRHRFIVDRWVWGAVPFGEYARSWIDERPGLRPKTLELYRYLLRSQLDPVFARWPVRDIREPHVRRCAKTAWTLGSAPLRLPRRTGC